jgi:hypothetical protein
MTATFLEQAVEGIADFPISVPGLMQGFFKAIVDTLLLQTLPSRVCKRLHRSFASTRMMMLLGENADPVNFL